jgi:hypothetical protein
MAKKSSKKRRIQRVTMPSYGAETTQKGGPVNLAEEYSYVVNDLLRMAVLAAILIAALIGLSFFL